MSPKKLPYWRLPAEIGHIFEGDLALDPEVLSFTLNACGCYSVDKVQTSYRVLCDEHAPDWLLQPEDEGA